MQENYRLQRGTLFEFTVKFLTLLESSDICCFKLDVFCLERYGWDELIPDSETAILRRWIKELQSVGQISVPRFHFVDWDGYEYDESAVLAGFGDASKLAYCAVVNIVKKAGAGGRNRVSLVTSKTRVAPVKKISTPRLKLLAALIVAQQALKSVMEISKTVCFSDSMTVLYWLKGQNSLKQLLMQLLCDNRVKGINKTADRDSWFHCQVKKTRRISEVGARFLISL